MKSDPALIRKILRHLHRRDYWGARHTSPKNAIKGIPGHLIGEAKNAITELIKEGFVLTKPTNYGTQIYLNREKKSLIEAIINEK